MPKILDEITVSRPRIIPNPTDLVFIPYARISDKSQKIESQIDTVKGALKSLNAEYHPQFEVHEPDESQHSTEGYHRDDFDLIKKHIEIGVDGLKANAICCERWDRIVGRDESGGYDVFGKIIARYCRDNFIEVYQLTTRKPVEDPSLGYESKESEVEAFKTKRRTSRGRYNRAKLGLPTSKYPFLWHYDEDDKEAYLIPERVKIFHKVCELYLSNEYTAKGLAEKMKQNGFYYYSHEDRLSNKKEEIRPNILSQNTLFFHLSTGKFFIRAFGMIGNPF